MIKFFKYMLAYFKNQAPEGFLKYDFRPAGMATCIDKDGQNYGVTLYFQCNDRGDIRFETAWPFPRNDYNKMNFIYWDDYWNGATLIVNKDRGFEDICEVTEID